MADIWGRTKSFFGNAFDPQGINRSNVGYVAQQQAKRAAGELGLSEAQKEARVATGQEQVGAATSAVLNQASYPGMSPEQRQALTTGAIQGMQSTLAQQKMGADLESQQQAANEAAELNALEQGLFQRRQAKRDFIVGSVGKGAEAGGEIGQAVALSKIAATAGAVCWVAVTLWGEGHAKTRLARHWCRTHDNAFTRAYVRHGQTWAGWVSRSRIARSVALPIWTLLAYLGERHLIRLIRSLEIHHG